MQVQSPNEVEKISISKSSLVQTRREEKRISRGNKEKPRGGRHVSEQTHCQQRRVMVRGSLLLNGDTGIMPLKVEPLLLLSGQDFY